MGPLPRGRLRAHQRPGRSSLAAVISAHRPRRRALTRRQPACDPAPRRLSVHLMACDRRCRQGGLRPCRSDTEARYHGPPSVSCLPRELRRQAARSPLMPRPPRGHDHTGNCILFIEDGHCPLLADRLLSCRTAICAAQRDGTRRWDGHRARPPPSPGWCAARAAATRCGWRGRAPAPSRAVWRMARQPSSARWRRRMAWRRRAGREGTGGGHDVRGLPGDGIVPGEQNEDGKR